MPLRDDGVNEEGIPLLEGAENLEQLMAVYCGTAVTRIMETVVNRMGDILTSIFGEKLGQYLEANLSRLDPPVQFDADVFGEWMNSTVTALIEDRVKVEVFSIGDLLAQMEEDAATNGDGGFRA